jgi:phage shock protein C
MTPHGLTQSETDRVIAGVAGGIAERFGVNATLLRVAWVLAIFVGGFSILLYAILCVALPRGAAQTPAIRIAEERYARGEISAAPGRRGGIGRPARGTKDHCPDPSRL